MRTSAAILGFVALSLLGAACGRPFTYETGGAGGTGGDTAASSSSSSGVTSTSSSSGGSEACTPGTTDCGVGRYCATTDCTTGTCKKKPATKGMEWSPVCGCDRVLYWNYDLALDDGVSFVDSASCNTTTMLDTCDPTMGKTCDHGNDIYCSMRADSGCGSPSTGTCVKVPKNCNGTVFTGTPCVGAACARACTLIKTELPWFVTNPACTLGG